MTKRLLTALLAALLCAPALAQAPDCGACSYTPDSDGINDISGTGDQDAAICIEAGDIDWTPASETLLFGQPGGVWATISAGGVLTLHWNDGSSDLALSATAAVPFSDSAFGCIRAQLDADDGFSNYCALFWTKTAGLASDAGGWIQLGGESCGS